MHPNPPHPRGAVALLLPEPPWGHAVTLGPWMPARWLQRGGLTKIIPHPHAPRAGMKPTPRRHVSGGTWRVPMACLHPSRAQGSLGWPRQWGQWVPPRPKPLGFGLGPGQTWPDPDPTAPAPRCSEPEGCPAPARRRIWPVIPPDQIQPQFGSLCAERGQPDPPRWCWQKPSPGPRSPKGPHSPDPIREDPGEKGRDPPQTPPASPTL